MLAWSPEAMTFRGRTSVAAQYECHLGLPGAERSGPVPTGAACLETRPWSDPERIGMWVATLVDAWIFEAMRSRGRTSVFTQNQCHLALPGAERSEPVPTGAACLETRPGRALGLDLPQVVLLDLLWVSRSGGVEAKSSEIGRLQLDSEPRSTS